MSGIIKEKRSKLSILINFSERMGKDKQKLRINELESDHDRTLYLIHLYLDRDKTIEYCCDVFNAEKDVLINFFTDINILNRRDELKMCTKCFEIKIRSSIYFYKKDNSYDGYNTNCIACKNEYCNDYYQENMEELNIQNRLYHKNNWDKILPVKQIWNELHKEERRKNGRAFCAKRKCLKESATPDWVNQEEINKIYNLVYKLELSDGILRHVDHIHPIKHPLVCGLHVPWMEFANFN